MHLNIFYINNWLIDTVDLEGSLRGFALLDALALIKTPTSDEPRGKVLTIWTVPGNPIALPQRLGDIDAVHQAVVSHEPPLELLPRSKTLQDIFTNSTEEDHLEQIHLVVETRLDLSLKIYDFNAHQLVDLNLLRGALVKDLVPMGTANSHTFHRPLTPIPVKGITKLAQSGQINLDSFKLVEIDELLVKLYPWGFNPDHVHFFIGLPPSTENMSDRDATGDQLPPLPAFNSRQNHFLSPRKSPSAESKPKAFSMLQRKDDFAIYCGRPGDRESRVPASLYNEALCRLQHDLATVQPTPEDKQYFQDLRTELNDIFDDELARKKIFAKLLKNIVDVEEVVSSTIESSKNGKKTRYVTDGDIREVIQVLNGELSCLILLQEVKNELVGIISDPFYEAICYFRAHIRNIFQQDRDVLCNFPAILLLHFGPYIVVAVAVFTDKPIVEHLVCIPLHAHTTNPHERAAGERMVCALRIAVQGLQQYYRGNPFRVEKPRTNPPQSNFPFRDYYTIGEKQYKFIYTEALDDKCVFRARLDENTDKSPENSENTQKGSEGPEKDLYVKFTRCYSEEAHRAAQEAGHAPKLLAVEDVYGWLMVVMEDVSSEYTTFWDLVTREERVAAREQAREAIVKIHDQGFVHGDVRDVNIMVKKDDPEDVMFIDWDWAGKIGQATYPYNVNKHSVIRPDGVERCGEILPEHDLGMVDLLKPCKP
ncbi:hypothetical protein QCA50_019806 [Cerrena zonata]|uniref:Non-specific serine/threonine protein kinase n=1 Tax=Cerrena zonata TaxID=2478898 RepID=A0AAW0FBI7_9APHY